MKPSQPNLRTRHMPPHQRSGIRPIDVHPLLFIRPSVNLSIHPSFSAHAPVHQSSHPPNTLPSSGYPTTRRPSGHLSILLPTTRPRASTRSFTHPAFCPTSPSSVRPPEHPSAHHMTRPGPSTLVVRSPVHPSVRPPQAPVHPSIRASIRTPFHPASCGKV